VHLRDGKLGFDSRQRQGIFSVSDPQQLQGTPSYQTDAGVKRAKRGTISLGLVLTASFGT